MTEAKRDHTDDPPFVLTSLSEWWLKLNDGEVVRLWATSYAVEDGTLRFETLVRDGEGTRLMELAAFPFSCVAQLEMGDGQDGLPQGLVQHEFHDDGELRAEFARPEHTPTVVEVRAPDDTWVLIDAALDLHFEMPDGLASIPGIEEREILDLLGRVKGLVVSIRSEGDVASSDPTSTRPLALTLVETVAAITILRAAVDRVEDEDSISDLGCPKSVARERLSAFEAMVQAAVTEQQ